MIPTPQDVADFVGSGTNEQTLLRAEQHLPVVTAMVKVYVRGLGLDATGEPAEDVVASTLPVSCPRAGYGRQRW
jgi:hypothetical protein